MNGTIKWNIIRNRS